MVTLVPWSLFSFTTQTVQCGKGKSRFTIMKTSTSRENIPLILAYGVTIHKCHGLTLDCAIVDLSDKVFSPRMAYVAVSQVRTLQGLHLFAFDPKSITVSALVQVTQLSLTKLQQREIEWSQPNQELSNLLRRHVVPVTLMLSFCFKNQTYLTNFIQWMSCGNATYVTLWAFGSVGQTK